MSDSDEKMPEAENRMVETNGEPCDWSTKECFQGAKQTIIQI